MLVSKPEASEAEQDCISLRSRKGNPDSSGLPFFFGAYRTERPAAVSGVAKQAGENYILITASACGPLGPCVTSNSTS